MNAIDLTPLYRNSIGFDRLATLFDSAFAADAGAGYPPYDIEVLGENQYAITLAVAGFSQSELDITVEKGVLTVRGKKVRDDKRQYLHQGITLRSFERKFNLADYVEVTGADLNQGLLAITLVKVIPETMKPRTIAINQGVSGLEHQTDPAQS
jgi:molecular chaperone IbpA